MAEQDQIKYCYKDCNKPAITILMTSGDSGWAQPLYYPQQWWCEEHTPNEKRLDGHNR